MTKPKLKEIEVVFCERTTPNMQRITFYSTELASLPHDCEGGYIKLLFNHNGGTDIRDYSENKRPIMRTYTIRKYCAHDCTIEVDFVCHTTTDINAGFASRWAMQAKAGDSISMGGPGIIKNLNSHADWFFMIADMTALPALSAKIKNLPADAKGYALIQVISKQDIQEIDAPSGINIDWLTDEDCLVEKARSLHWHAGIPFAWVACEFDSMKQLRQYFTNEKALNKSNMYISSYWKKGVTEDGHKIIKYEDAQSLG
ncbi:NADPH-dependent ferric siderophore reductase [Vibrio sp. UCD-FRSSP16_10]|uniref:siderophore-interacting protein n=1 Tax=unclassified Vibrio TaxID=2614977 RepID=UPI0007FDE1EB|nr:MULTISPECIES: siderophore-interacting protein [unclassified Vibrio]OBT13855.1 NADPH-dependent ferric siderophore reductase [Vibrio sp. UCD-FRSSP16_30]OBT22736.1 NADPH-dependent ferric siderophore reductase [Vibrio sp. UCD-FRSSP16_10]